MILDVRDNAKLYLRLNRGFPSAFEFLVRQDLSELPDGRYEIDGERVYAMVSSSKGRSRADARLEAHDRYIDIQLVLAGTDEMGWKPRAACTMPYGDYDEPNDVRFFADEPDAWITAAAGAFVVFFPHDAHMPLISSGLVRKVVVKVATDPAEKAGERQLRTRV